MTEDIVTTTRESYVAADKKPIPLRVLIYMAADNNLTEECIYALTEIQKVGTIEGVETIALFDSGAKGVKTNIYDFSNNSNGGDEAHDAKTKKDKPLKDIARAFSDLVPAEQGNLAGGAPRKSESASDPKVLRDFLGEYIDRRQAERFLVVLSGHGSGAVGDFLRGNNPPRSLSIHELASALNKVKENIGDKIHILGMDSCLMSMAEVCAQLAESVHVMVGAEGFELNTGWPYQKILEALKPTISRNAPTEELACTIVREYIHYYQDYEDAGVSVDQAAIDLSKFDKVIEAVGKLAKALTEKISDPKIQDAILLAHWRAQSYKNEQYVDLWDFCDLLQKVYDELEIKNTRGSVNEVKDAADSMNKDAADSMNEVKDACASVKKTIFDLENLGDRVVLMSRYHGAAFQHSHGLSIFFPWRGVERRVKSVEPKDSEEKPDDLTAYKTLKFHIETRKSSGTGWGDFLEAYVEETRRKMRGEQEPAYKNAGPICIVPTDESRMVVRNGPPVDKGEGRGAGSMKNPPVCFISEAWGQENDEAAAVDAD